MFGNRRIEFFLTQCVLYLLLWLWDEYIATLLIVIFVPILTAILGISFIVEWIQPSRVPRSYFSWMGLSIFAPLLATFIYLLLMGGNVQWQ